VRRSLAEQRRYQMADQLGGEGVAGKGDTIGGDFAISGCTAKAGADLQERKVAGAAAEVGGGNQLVVVQAHCVGVRGADGLVFEDDVIEASIGEAFAEAGDGPVIVFFGFRSREAHGTAYDRPRAERT